MTFLSTLLLSVFITIALIPFCCKLAVRLHVLDEPDARKVHTQPIPRCGGVAMAIGAFAPLLYWQSGDALVRAWLLGASVIVLFGVADDFRGIGYRTKFAGQIAAALIAVFYGGIRITSLGSLLPDGILLADWISVPLTVIAIVGVTNAINLADGLDGLAGGISLLGFCCLGYLGYIEGNLVIGLVTVALAGAIFGFLRFNTFPATVFMGDTGSMLLGYSAIVLSIALTQGSTPLSPLLPLLLLGFPVLDTLAVMGQRIAEGRSPFSPDKNHFHHNLIALGLQHRESVLAIYVIQTALVLAAFFLRYHSEWLLLGLYTVFSGTILAAFALARKAGWQLKRFDILDITLLGFLRRLRESGILIRIGFRVFEIGVPLLLLFTCLLPSAIPSYVSLASLGLLAVFFVTWLTMRKVNGIVLWPALYILIPFAVYLGDTSTATWMSGAMIKAYNLTFGLFTVFVILVTKFSRRRGGFKSTPLDFLILFIAVVVPNLPDPVLSEYRMGFVAAKIIMLYFSYEVLMGELRGETGKVALVTMASLAVIGVKGLI